MHAFEMRTSGQFSRPLYVMSSQRKGKSCDDKPTSVSPPSSPKRNAPPPSEQSKRKSSQEVGGNVTKETASPANICTRVALFSACWMSIAFCLKLFLEPSLEGKIFDIFVQVLFCVLTLAIADVLLCRSSPARWFILHAFGNFIIVYFSIADTVNPRCPCFCAKNRCFLPRHFISTVIWLIHFCRFLPS